MNIEQPLPPELQRKVEVSAPQKDDIENWFTYHSPTEESIPKYKDIRKMGLKFARGIMDNCPPSADRSAAIRKVREAVMTANAAIACCGQ